MSLLKCHSLAVVTMDLFEDMKSRHLPHMNSIFSHAVVWETLVWICKGFVKCIIEA